MVLLAFAVPWAWMNRPQVATSLIRWFVAAVFLVVITSIVTLCCFFDVNDWYRWDYLPCLMLMSVIGFLALARVTLRNRPYGPLIRWGWCLLLGYSITFSGLSNIESHATAYCRAGKDLFFEYHFDEAMVQYRKAQALWPDCVEAHCALGNIFVGEGNISNGITEYQKALAIRPDYTEADNNLGYTLIRLGRVSEAIVYFQRVLQFEQSYQPRTRAYFNLGYAYQLDGNAAEAADCYQKALELQPQFLPAQISLAWMRATSSDAALRNGSQAVALMENANQLSSGKNPKVLRTLAAAYAEAGRFDDAITTAQKAIALAKQSGETNVLEENEKFLNLYFKHQPYHQSQTGKGN